MPSPLLAALAAVALAGMLGIAAAQQNVVMTQYGRISGLSMTVDGVELVAYLGIPFAAPPTGANRFRPPQPHERWNGIKNCDDEKIFHVCPQLHVTNNTVYGQEDCLYMNIYVPVKAVQQGPAAVMFWIYGGGFVFGDSFEFGRYRGIHIAAQRGVIVVEPNYRLGSLGFFSHPDLLAESTTTGNYALQDQTLALQFAYNNIANFGGDPNRIAIFGESAGGFSVCWHLVNEASAGYFSAAIMESGSCTAPEFFISLPRSYEFTQEVINYVGCNKNESDVLDCIRAVNFEDLMSVRAWPQNATVPPLAPVMPWGPAIDGSPLGLLDRPINLMKVGQFNRVPVIMGTNKDEGTIFVPAISIVTDTPFPIPENRVAPAMLHFFNQTAVDQIVNTMYPESSGLTTFRRVALILRDYFFLCATRRTARTVSSFGVPVYLYQFNYNMSNWNDYEELGNYHSSELEFIFQNYKADGKHPLDAEEQRLADSFTLYWTNMAKYGGPNFNLGPDQAVWPRYNTTTDLNLFMLVPTQVGGNLNEDLCDQWDQIFPIYS